MEEYLRDATLGVHIDHEVCLCMSDWPDGEPAYSIVTKNLSCGWRQDIDLSSPFIAEIPKSDASQEEQEAYVKRRHLMKNLGGAQTLCSAGAYVDSLAQLSVSRTKQTPDRTTPTPRRRELIPFFSPTMPGGSVSSGPPPGLGGVFNRNSSKTSGKASKSPKTPKQKAFGGSVSRKNVTNNSYSGGRFPSTVTSRVDTARQASKETPRSYCTGTPQGLGESMFDSMVDAALSKFSLYRLDRPDSEFVQSYEAPPAEAFDLGCMVPPSRKDISMIKALSELGDSVGLKSFERSLYQIAALRSRAMSIAWSTFMRRMSELVHKSVTHSAKIIVQMLKYNGVSGPLLQLIIADVGVVNNDKTKVLDTLISLIEEDKKQHIVIKVKLGNSIQATLEYIYMQLRHRATNSRSMSTNDQIYLDTVVRRSIFQSISELYEWRFRNRQIVIVIEKISHNLCEFLYILQLLKNHEGLIMSCILCANCWQTNLDQHVSLRVYRNLCIVNCDVLSVNRLSEEILRVVLFESETQCFLPHLMQLEVMWNSLYDNEMSINALIRRIYRLYEHFYRTSQLSFACLPNLVNIKATVREMDGAPGFDIEANENLGEVLHSKLGLLYCGVDFSDSHLAYLQLVLDHDSEEETICLHKLPQETIQLYERRLGMQLGMFILYELLTYLPNCNRLRDRLSLLACTFHSENTVQRVYDIIQRVTRRIAGMAERNLSAVISTMKDMGPHFLTMYPAVRTLNCYLGHSPRHDLVQEYTTASTEGTRAGLVANFVEHSLTFLLMPGMHRGSRLAHHIMFCRFQHHVYDWNLLYMLLTTRQCTGYARDLKELITLSQAMATHKINLWDLFCLFSSRLHEDTVASVFIRFSMAVDALTHILGYYACTNIRSQVLIDFSSDEYFTFDMRLMKAIKTKLSRFKARRIHLGKYL